MTKSILCLGICLTFVLFVTPGYSIGDDCGAGTDCADRQVPNSAEMVPETANSETVMPSTHELDRNACNHERIEPGSEALATTLHGDSYLLVPALVLTLTDSTPRLSLCPGVVEIHR